MSKIIAENCEFWMVWTKTGSKPRYTHRDEAKALCEAERLAEKHPGKKFIVLRGYHKVHVPAPEQIAA